jgi:hypothetical protein
MSDWICVEDRLPDEGDFVLTNCKHGVIEGTLDEYTGGGTATFCNYYWRDMEWYATHWMPCPEMPVLDKE